MTKSLKAKTKQQLKKTTLIWQDLVTMSIQLESREMFISTREICKENTTKEIPGLKYLMKLFQNQKLESELSDFQSVLIVLSHPLFLNELQISEKWVKGQLILGVIFSF